MATCTLGSRGVPNRDPVSGAAYYAALLFFCCHAHHHRSSATDAVSRIAECFMRQPRRKNSGYSKRPPSSTRPPPARQDAHFTEHGRSERRGEEVHAKLQRRPPLQSHASGVGVLCLQWSLALSPRARFADVARRAMRPASRSRFGKAGNAAADFFSIR